MDKECSSYNMLHLGMQCGNYIFNQINIDYLFKPLGSVSMVKAYIEVVIKFCN